MAVITAFKFLPSLNSIQFFDSTSLGLSHDEYLVESKSVSFNNGNGRTNLIIKNNDGECDVFRNGWVLKSPIELSFNWSGYFGSISVYDNTGVVRKLPTADDKISIFKHSGDFTFYVRSALEEFLNVSGSKHWVHYDLTRRRRALVEELEYVEMKLKEL